MCEINEGQEYEMEELSNDNFSITTHEDIYKNVNTGNKLFDENIKLVFHMLKKYRDILPYSYTDDLIQCGMIELYKATFTYDKNKEASFATYACRGIRFGMLNFVQKIKGRKEDDPRRKVDSISDPIAYAKDGNFISLEDMLYNTKDMVEFNIINNECLYYLDFLTGRIKQIILLRMEGYTQQKISDIMGISRSYVSRLEAKGYKQLRLLMETSINNINTILNYLDKNNKTYSSSSTVKITNELNFIFKIDRRIINIIAHSWLVKNGCEYYK